MLIHNAEVTGSLTINNVPFNSGSFSGSFRGDGSQLTGIDTDPFPYTGSAIVSGSLNVIGDLLQNGLPIETDPFPYTGSAIISGSLNVIGDLLQNGAAIETDPFPYTGSAIISGSLVVTGSLNVSGGVTGSFTGSFVGNGSGLTGVTNATTASYVELSNVNGSASLATRLTDLESFSSSLDTIYATDAQLNAATSSLSGSISSLSSSFLAYTASQNALNSTFTTTSSFNAFSSSINSFTASQNALNSTFTTTSSFNAFSSSINSFTASQNALNATFATTGSNIFFGTQVITGSLFISNNLVVQGSSSLQNITASVVSIGTNTVILNTDTPSVRFGGISVQDSGSGAGASGSLFWDSLNNHWIYQHPTGGVESAVTARLISGPANSGSLGNELGITPGKIMVASGDDHIIDSIITQATNNLSISIDGALNVTGSVTSTQGFTGSFTGSLTGTATNATSASYAVSASHVIGGVDPFPYTGSAIISGSLAVSGSVGFSYLSSGGGGGGGGTWSTGGSLINAIRSLGVVGAQSAALAFGGRDNYGAISCTEEYNGASWTAGGALITARQLLAGAGTQNAGLAFGGLTYNSCTEEYDGTSWSAGGALITARFILAGAGMQNAGLAFGGLGGGSNCTEEYDGSTWSSGGALIDARNALGGVGTQNAGLAFGGDFGGTLLSCTEEYDGTSWSSGGALITTRTNLAGAGVQNEALAFGGSDVAPTFTLYGCTEEYNGTSWSSRSSLITSRRQLGGAGNSIAGLAAGGYDNSTPLSSTEEYSSGGGGGGSYIKTFDYSSTTGQISATGSFTGSFVGDGSNLTGLPPGYSVTNSSDNRVITSVNSTTGNAEANLTFDGTVLNITGNVTASGGFSGNLSGNASTATILQTARNIGGVSFNGSANIDLPGVNTSGNQNTSGNAATSTTLQTARTIGGVSFNGSANINLPGVNTAGNQDTSGTATNATNFNVEADDSTNAAHFIIFTGGATGNQRPNSDSALTYNPSTNLLSAGCFVETSALRCKDNIHPISSPLDKVKQLKPVTFDWKHSGKNDIGFIAEEVKEVLPNLIHYNEEGEVEGMNYSKVTSLLVAAIQEQQEQINELKQEINNLKNK
jgi:hypothetical protein